MRLAGAFASASAEHPVVAAESTIFSELGLPDPYNREALNRCRQAVIGNGAEFALTAVLDGVATVGVKAADFDRICGPTRKVAERDIPVAIAQGWDYGATTVSASLALAAHAGLRVFATGGIGGVHTGVEQSGDISADLPALAKHRVVTVSAGAKVFLDLPRTLEYLETWSVPVIGWQTDEFPAFHARTSGLPVAHRADTAEEVAAIAQAHWDLGGGGILVTAPVPEPDALAWDELIQAAEEAVRRADADGVAGNAVTPAVLGHLASITDGRTIGANLALAENNAAVAAQIAVAISSRQV